MPVAAPPGPVPGATPRPRRPRHPSRRAAAAAVGLVLALTSLTPAALADTGPTAPPAPSTAAAGGPVTPEAMAAADARRAAEKPLVTAADKAKAQARATGKPVPVPELTDEFSETVATPEGRLSRTQHVEQQRVKQDGRWADLDASLVADPAGGYRPKAAASGVRLSAGGSGPLGTLTAPGGEVLAIDSPFPLTTPRVDEDGDGLLYPEVLPGVDLKAGVSRQGALSTVLVVKNAEAAKNPKLKKIRFGTRATGVTVKADKDNNLTATAADGTLRWHASAPQMWDSSAAPASPAASAAPAGKSAQGAPGAADGAAAGPKGAVASSADGPGDGARVAVMPTAVTADAVELTPDPAVLGQGQGPWYIDPAWIPDAREGNAWTWTQEAYPNWSNYNKTTTNGGDQYSHPGVGYQGWRTEKGRERSFFQLNTDWYHDIVINKATMTVWQYESADWSCTKTYPVDLYLTGGISNSTSWNNEPGRIGGVIGSRPVGGSRHDGCAGTTAFEYDVTGVYRAHAPSNHNLTFGLVSPLEGATPNSGDRNAFKRMDYKPVVVVEYDRVPNTPTNPYAWPAPTTAVPWQENQGCDGQTMGWLNSASGFGGAVSLNATVSSSVQNQLQSWSHIWDYSLPGVPDVASGLSPWVGNGGNATFDVPQHVIVDGHVYGWGTHATDGLVQMSNSTPVCRFGVDLTPPTISVPNGYTQLSEADLADKYPPSGNGQVSRKRTGERGTVPFTAADPAANNGSASGIACARWSWDPQLAGAGWVCGSSMPQGGAEVTPNRWGTNILYLQVMDNARNVSPIASYAFYVPWNPDGPPPVFGDVTGDSVPDIVTPDQSGVLRSYAVPGNSQANSANAALLATRADAPGGLGWGDVQFAHRGTFTGGNNIDDFVVHAPGDANLYVMPNPGNTGQYGRIDRQVPIGKPRCTVTPAENCSWTTLPGYHAADWSKVLRVASLGDPVNTDLDYRLKFKNKSGLLTVEANADGTDAALWYYPATETNTLGKPVRLAASGWKDKDLIAPGDWAKQGHPGLWTRNRQASPDGAKDDLLAYTFTTGTVVSTTNQGQPVLDGAGNPVTVPTLTGVSGPVKIGAVPVETWPVIGSDGDLTGKGSPSLWGRTPEGRVDIWWGETVDPGSANPSYTWHAGPQTVAETTVNPLWWGLDGRSQGADSTQANPLTAHQSVGTTADHNGTADAAAALNGTGYYRSTHAAGVDTRQSYSVSAWVKLGHTNGYQTAVSLVGQERSPFYLHYVPWANQWAFTLTGEDAENTNAYYSAFGGAAAGPGVWTHLTGTYNAGTGNVTLYLNGRPVGSTRAPQTWAAGGGLLVGAEGSTKSGTPAGNLFSGAVSDVRVYPYALTEPQARGLATVGSSVQIRSAYNAGVCIDNWGGTEGAQPRAHTCYNGAAQHFTLTAENQIKVPGTQRCVTTQDVPAGWGSKVVILPCGQADRQTWVRKNDGSLYNPASGSCLELPGWNDANGTVLGIWQCNGNPNQRWHLEAQA